MTTEQKLDQIVEYINSMKKSLVRGLLTDDDVKNMIVNYTVRLLLPDIKETNNANQDS